MPRDWTGLACPVCDALTVDREEILEHEANPVRCNGTDGERHKLTAMKLVTLLEVPPGMRAEIFDDA